ncbi:hypothetical protein NQ318_000471, partial [Aromia moschata]
VCPGRQSLRELFASGVVTKMKLFVFALLFAAALSEKLQNNYLPPLSAKTAGGSGSFLSAPRPTFAPSFATGSAFTPSGIATSYAAPPSGPAPSGLYGAPKTYSTGIPTAILRFNNENNGDGSYRFETHSHIPAASTSSPVIYYESALSPITGEGFWLLFPQVVLAVPLKYIILMTYNSVLKLTSILSHAVIPFSHYRYQTENKISQQEQGHVQNAGGTQESTIVHGSYTYEAPDGQTITVEYVADENGFRASGDHIPTPPPIPAAIQRSLEINAAAQKTVGYSSPDFSGPSSGTYQQPQVTRQYLAPTTKSAGYRY